MSEFRDIEEINTTHRELFVDVLRYNWTEAGVVGKLLVVGLVLASGNLVRELALIVLAHF